MTIDELIAQLEAAYNGDRALDRSIAQIVGTYSAPDRGDPEGTWPRYTTLLDDAMDLVPKVNWRVYALQEEYIWPPGKWFAGLDHRRMPAQAGSQMGKASMPALALCIAALKARKRSEEMMK